jgi:MOSC domain-containing protein YiiM
MQIVSVNVGLPRTVRWKRRDVTTGIFKEPIKGRISLRRLNLDGDRQADLSVHGGATKAVYAYPLEHYAFWREELRQELPFGAFGENLTVEGLPLEEEVAVGDRFRIGTAELVVTQPRVPCYKLGLRFGREDMVRRLLASRRTGYYLAVEVEGDVGAGDRVETLARHPARTPVAEIIRVYASDRDDLETIERLVVVDALPKDWRRYFEKKLAEKIATAIDETIGQRVDDRPVDSDRAARAAALSAPLREDDEGRRPRAPRPRRTTAAT